MRIKIVKKDEETNEGLVVLMPRMRKAFLPGPLA